MTKLSFDLTKSINTLLRAMIVITFYIDRFVRFVVRAYFTKSESLSSSDRATCFLSCNSFSYVSFHLNIRHKSIIDLKICLCSPYIDTGYTCKRCLI